MKKFYTFGPQNSDFWNKMKGFLAVAMMFVMAVGNVNAQVYQLVTDASTLAAGDQVVIASADYDYAMGGQNTNNRAAEAITKTGSVITWTSSVATLTLEAGIETGTFALKTADDKYLYASSGSSNQLKDKAEVDANASWLITISNGVASIVAQGSNTRNTMRYNTSKLFSCYSPSNTQKDLCIYKYGCPEVTNLAGTPDVTSASISWNCIGNAFNYKLNNVAGTYTPVQNGTAWSLNLTDLTPNTEYTFSVKSTCATEYTDYTFTTLCPNLNNSITETIYEGESYTFGTQVLTTTGIYQETFAGSYGCDSVVTLNLAVLRGPNYYVESQEVCGSYTFETFDGPVTLTTSGTYTYTEAGAAQGGLDSIRELTLIVYPAYELPNVDVQICQNELPYVFGDLTFGVNTPVGTMPVLFTHTFQTANGCDSTVTISLTVNPLYEVEDELTICENELPYTWNGKEFTEAGTQTVTLVSTTGCDSIVTMTLNVNENTEYVINAEIVENDLPYVLNGTSYTTSGNYEQTLVNANNCDSIVKLNLTVYMNVTNSVSDTICDNQFPYDWETESFTEAGSKTLTFTGVNGNDSTVTMTLVVNPTYDIAEERSICETELPYTWNEVVFTEAGEQTANFQSINGCDSVVRMTLTVNPTSTATEELTICVNEIPYTWNDTTFEAGTAAGDYTYVYNTNNIYNCDSTTTLTLHITDVDACTFTVDFEQPENGTITGPATVALGEDAEYTFAPVSDCYILTSVVLDGADVTADLEGNTLKLDSVYTRHELSATYTMLTYTVAVAAVENGTITGAGTYDCGENVTVNITPNEGYHIVDVIVDGDSKGVYTSYTFRNNHADRTVSAVFAINEYTLTANAGAHGTITPAGETTVEWHGTQTYTITPDDCYEITSVTVNGEEVEIADSYTFSNVDRDTTIEVAFGKISYDMTWTNIGDGEGTVDGVAEGEAFANVECGDLVSGYVVTAAQGSVLRKVVWNGFAIPLPDLDTWTINIPMTVAAANTNVEVEFALKEYTVTTHVAAPAGTATPTTQTIKYNHSAEIEVAAAVPAYHIEKVVCGPETTYATNNEVELTYTVANVTSDTDVYVYFAINEYTITVNDPENGTVTPSGTVTVPYGSDQTFTITPDDCYHVESVIADGTTPMTEYTFTSVTENHTLDVTFAMTEYAMTGIAHTEGEVVGGTANCGSNFNYTITANEGYHIDSVVCNGLTSTFGNQPSEITFPVSNVQSDTQIDAYISINKYNVTASANHGTIDPTTAEIEHNGMAKFNLSADNCYELSSVTVNGEDVTADVDTLSSSTINTLLNQTFDAIEGGTSNPENCYFKSGAITIGNTYPGWTGQSVYPADGKLKLGASSSLGWIQLPAQDLSACTEFHVKFDAKAYYTRNSTESTEMYVIVNGESRTISLSDATGCNLQTYDEVFTNPTANTTIRFEAKQANASRFLLDNISVFYGEGATFALNVSPVTEDINVVADFSQIEYEATTSVIAGNGEITPDFTLLCGETSPVTMTAAPGYHISYYTVNGVSSTVSHDNAYTTETIQLEGISDMDVQVAFELNEYTVTTLAVTGQGSFDPVTTTVAHDGSVTVTVNADAANGYHIEDIFTDATNVDTLGENTDITAEFTLNNIVSDTTIKANFALNIYPITVINLNPDHGTVAPMTQDWNWGGAAPFVITPEAPCYYISEITVGGVTLDPSEYTADGYTYTFPNVTAADTLQVNFTDSLFAMTATIVPGSSATVNTGDVHCGDNDTLNIVAAEGQHLATIFVDGLLDTVFTNQEDEYSVIFTDIHENHNVTIYTATDDYVVNVTTNGEGSTNYDGEYTDVVYNTAFDFIFAPKACQELVSFTINGEEYVDEVSGNAYTWNANDNADIVVTFDTIVYNMTATYNAEGGQVIEGTANCGETYDYEIVANQGWHIASYQIDTLDITMGNNSDTEASVTVDADSDKNLTALFERNTYTVTVCDPGNGNTLSADPTTVYYDSTSVITVTAATGYHITSINGNRTTGENTVVNETYNVENIQNDTAICAEFALNNYTITASTTSVQGAITNEGETHVQWGDTVEYTITSNTPCYYISTVVIDGDTTFYNDSVAFTYTFADIQADHSIEASFETYKYTVATQAITEGTITETATLNCGSDFVFTATPNAGYHIDSVMIDGVADTNFTLADSLGYTNTITNLMADHTVDAYFSINNYTIDVTANENGTITPGDTVLTDGQTITYTITPDPCHYISEILVDGEASAIEDINGATIEFENVSAAHTLEASFAIYEYVMDETHTGNGTVSTATVNCGSEYTYEITADQGWHIVSYQLGASTFYNTLTEPNDYNNETVVISNASQDTMLNVVFAIDTYTVTACTGVVGGTLTVNDPVEVDSNSNTTVTVIADSLNGYHIVSITDNRGGRLDLGANTNTTCTYRVNAVDQDIEVCATFAKNEFVISASVEGNGTITPAGDTTIDFDETITYTIAPEQPCYYISAITVDGNNVWTGYTDSISAVDHTFTAADFDQSVVNHTIAAEFSIFQYNMASNAYTEGTVSSAIVDCATDYDYVITSNVGYHIDHIVLDGVTTNYAGQQANDVVTVLDIHENHQLDAYFAINHYDIVATAEGNGTITPVGTTDVEHFSSLTYTITPVQPCYHVADVLVDGSSVGAVETYTFEDIDGGHTIHAIFAINEYNMAETHVGNGTVTTATVECGDSYIYTMTADNGWHINYHTLGGVTYTLNHNSDITAQRSVNAAMSDTTLDVVFSRNLYNIDVTTTGNGTTTPGDTMVEFEANVTYNMVPATGYHVVDVVVDGVSQGAVNTYSFNNVDADHTLDVTFEADIFTITASAAPHGSITVAGDNQVAYGESVNFTIVADECYHISGVLVDGVADDSFRHTGSVATYTMNNVDADHTVEAQFAINTYNVDVTSTGNGTVTPASGTYNCGDVVNFSFVPASGSAVQSVVVNGENIGAVTSYVINGIASDYTIDVTFSDEVYTLTAEAYNYGTITPAGETTVGYNGTMTYTLTPDACQTVSEILVDGVSYLDSANFDGTTLTLSDIQRDMLIQAYFQVMTYNVEATQVEGGAITESGIYNCGTDVVYNITAADCYTLTDVLVDGASVGAVDTYTFNAIDANHTITATFEMNTYVITSTATAGGTITATNTFNCGETPTYTITPDEGYFIVNVDVDGVSQGAISEYTFTSLNADHNINATFAQYTYTISATANNGVEISPVAGDTTVAYGESVTYTFTADACYEIADVTVDGESVGAVTTYTIDAVDADHIINVIATVKSYTITATATGNGTIAPAGETTVVCDGSQNYTFTPAQGYYIEDVMVDGASVGVVASYNFTNVNADHTIEVVFAAQDSLTYTIAATATGNGTITPAGVVTVYYGASQTFVMTADPYYAIAQVIVDGEVLANPVASYTFTNVMADHTIEVVFTEADCPVPTNAWTDEIDYTSATLNWTDMDVTSYTIRYKRADEANFTEVTGITDNFYVLTGLQDGVDYIWNVKSVCVEDVAESVWSAQQHFTTIPTGLNENDLNAMNVYSYGSDIYVVNNGNEQIKDVQVFDINGRLIYNGNVQSNPMVINVNAANGLYVVRVVTESSVLNYKVSISQR